MFKSYAGLMIMIVWVWGHSMATAHPGHSHQNDGEFELPARPVVERLAADEFALALAELDPGQFTKSDKNAPEIARVFEAFVKLKEVRTRWDERFFYVESNGIPKHPMMVGITNWQQQVPLPQAYSGENSWRIPLNPVPAKNPLTTKNRFLRGAIAVAANGIPIFNPLNNRGEDAFLIGELDEFGGHCGRADDYHYHIAPVHLEKTVGKGLPIAFAMDGYPIYGYEEPDGSKVKGLDEFNGHNDAQGQYHYHATKTYPYLNGGFHGEVVERGGQVDPQPRAEPIRPDGRPLRDAKITDFTEIKPNNYRLTYEVRGKKASITYAVSEDGSARFEYVDVDGKSRTESYTAKRRGPGGRRPEPRDPPPPRRDPNEPGAADKNPPADQPGSVASDGIGNVGQLTVSSSVLDQNGYLPAEFTCDGASASPPVAWSSGPQGTKAYAISLWHTAPDQVKSYWVIYNIPAHVDQLEKNSKGVGTVGTNDKRKTAYDPMCSKGPGVKTYHITVYALSEELKLTPEKATRANLLAAIKSIVLAKGTLDFKYERKK